MRFFCLSTLSWLLLSPLLLGVEPIFSGPQVGEELTPFEARVVFGEDAGKKIPVLRTSNEKKNKTDSKTPSDPADPATSPTLIVFVHQVTRPALGLVRVVMNYAETKQKDGMQSQLVFLSDDSTDTEAWLRRARRALPNAVSPLISVDGADGPGAYGLNRKVTLTVLVADEGKVTANFPLIQPSIQVDGPKIGRAIALALGEKKSPTLRDMGFEDRRMNMRKGRGGLSPEQQGTYRRMMGPLIQKNATEKQVEAAAKAISEFADKHAWFKTKVHQASTLIVGGGRLANYGTAKAQGYLKTWSTEFAPAPKENAAGNAGKERPAASSKSKTTEANEPQETESAESVATPQ